MKNRLVSLDATHLALWFSDEFVLTVKFWNWCGPYWLDEEGCLATAFGPFTLEIVR